MKKFALILSVLVATLVFLTPCGAERQGGGAWVIGPFTLAAGDTLQINMLNVSDGIVDGSLNFYDRNGRLIGAGPILWDDHPPVEGPKYAQYFDSANNETNPDLNRVGIDFIDGVASLDEPELQPIWAEIRTNLRSATKVLLPTVEIRYVNGESVISAIPLPIP